MGEIASQITILPVVYLTAYSGADQRKYQGSASLAFVRGIHRWPVNSPHKGPVTRKMFAFDDIMICEIVLRPPYHVKIDVELKTYFDHTKLICRPAKPYNGSISKLYNFHEITRSDNLPGQAKKLSICFACEYLGLAAGIKLYYIRNTISDAWHVAWYIISCLYYHKYLYTFIVEGKYLEFTVSKITYILKLTVVELLPHSEWGEQGWRHVSIYKEYVTLFQINHTECTPNVDSERHMWQLWVINVSKFLHAYYIKFEYCQ